MTFKELPLTEALYKALDDKQFESPTPIQEQVIPSAVVGSDILGIAQTGTGKTAAFVIPIIKQLEEYSPKHKRRAIKALILTPTRELAIQIDQEISHYIKYTSLKHTVIFGGVKQGNQVAQLKEGVDILTATPGRLLDLMQQGYIKLDRIRHFVLDEADRMLDMGFVHDIKRLLPLLPSKKQTLLFSATMPKEIAAISESLLHEPKKIEITPVASIVELIEQHFIPVEKSEKMDALVELLETLRDKTILIFSRTKYGADKIAKKLNKKGFQCDAIHGDKSQNARQRAIEGIKSGKINMIVATDVAARGIDINNLGVVINYDLPDMRETYVHRIGRTGRAGREGVAYSFCLPEEQQEWEQIQNPTNQPNKKNIKRIKKIDGKTNNHRKTGPRKTQRTEKKTQTRAQRRTPKQRN